MARTVLVLFVWMAAVASALAEESTQPIVVNPATLKFTTPPGFPSCAKAAALRGDPTKGPAVLFVRLGVRCSIPWHWHSANEQVMIASGSGTLEMKGDEPLRLQPGAYAFLPAHHVHRASCAGACTLFNTADGIFDIHYVDAAGNEIPAADALKTKAKKR